MPLTPNQKLLAASPARFLVGVTGRRFGKTHIARHRACKVAAQVNKKVAYVAPTYKMAKRIAWKKFKYHLQRLKWVEGKPNESDLLLALKSGSTIQLFGAENYDAIRGLEFDHIVNDEFADHPLEAWDEVLRACLANTIGSADFFGSPEGYNHLHEFYKRGQSDDAVWKDWASYHFTTLDGGQVPESEIEAAKNELDELTFQQEYLASFINFSGRAYYAFSEKNWGRLEYDPTDDLIVMFDFNVAPGTCVVAQEQQLPSGFWGTGIIAEVYIPRSSNTEYVCEQLLGKFGNHKGEVVAYGDASGGNKTTQGVTGSDWDIIDERLTRAYGTRYNKSVPRGNPRERARVNAVNSRCRSMGNQVKLMVDPSGAPKTIEDFESVRLLEGSNGRIDKSAKGDNARFTHLTDAIGYYIHREFSTENKAYGYDLLG